MTAGLITTTNPVLNNRGHTLVDNHHRIKQPAKPSRHHGWHMRCSAE